MKLTDLQISSMVGEFVSNNPENIMLVKKARRLTNMYNNSDYDAVVVRRTILEELLGSIGDNVAIDTPFYCDYGENIHIGNNVIININCTFVDSTKIEIGNNTLIASNVQLYTATHPVNPYERLIDGWSPIQGGAFFRTSVMPIKIGQNVWIGGGAIVLPGVTIGDNTVIGAGSIVNKDIPANCVAVGNPCKVIKSV